MVAGRIAGFCCVDALAFSAGLGAKKLSATSSKRIQTAAIVAALLGLYFTYQDFRQNVSHRWLGERFHLGGYLFWIGWIIISVFYLSAYRKKSQMADALTDQDSLPASNRETL